MKYQKPELTIVSAAHLAVLDMHPCAGMGTKVGVVGDDCVTVMTDGAYSIDE